MSPRRLLLTRKERRVPDLGHGFRGWWPGLPVSLLTRPPCCSRGRPRERGPGPWGGGSQSRENMALNTGAHTHREQIKVGPKKHLKNSPPRPPQPGLPESVVTDSPELVNGICGLQDAACPWKMTDKLLSPLHSPPAQACPRRALGTPQLRSGRQELTAPCLARHPPPATSCPGPLSPAGPELPARPAPRGLGVGRGVGLEEGSGGGRGEGRVGIPQRVGKAFPASVGDARAPEQASLGGSVSTAEDK